MLKVIPADQRDAMRIKMSESNALRDEIDETFEEESFAISKRPEIRQLEEGEVSCESCIYGYEIFKYSPSTFAPSNNIPLPSTYILGPGDKIKISYFGNETISLEKFISRDGNLDLPEIGPVPLAGLNFEEARKLVKSRVQQDFVGTDVSITITELRSINVYLLGQAYKPGSYTLSSLSTLTNALFVTGGVNEEGSLRNIELKRNGKTIKVYDFYDFLVFGNSSNDLRLQEGDTIFIPYIENKFEVIGGFKRPYLYEMKDGETLSDVIKLAGGFSFEVGSSPIIELDTVNVASNSRNLLKLDASAENLNRPINNGDVIGVSEIKALMYEYVKLKGEITKPGSYSIRPGDTLLDIINRAGGYTENAYPLGAIFTRESVAMQQKEAFLRNAETLEKFIVNSFTSGSIAGATAGVGEYTFSPITTLIRRLRTIEPVGRQTISADILTLKTDAYKNIFLMGGDELFIPKRPNSVNVVGEVLNTTTLNFDPSFTLENYIEMSGGLTNYADDNNIYIINPDGSSYTHKKSLFKNSSNVLPGSTIVVSRELRTLDGISLAKIISPVLADLATTAAAIAVLND
jgi:protein involved in polysaccharide export with SLBB domain